MVSPVLNPPPSSSLARWLTNSFINYRLRGLAQKQDRSPYLQWDPWLHRWSWCWYLAMPGFCHLLQHQRNIFCFASALLNGVNTIFFINPVEKLRLRFSFKISNTSSRVVSMISALCFSPKSIKVFKIFKRIFSPMLEVIITMVLWKLATLPLLSVSLPSSSNWSNILNVSGWAFSISSNKTMV